MTVTLPEWMTTTGPLDVSTLRLPDPDDPAHRDLYVRDGSRFVRVGQAPATAPEEHLPAGWRTDPDSPMRTLVHAPKCPHGHYTRWALGSDPKTGAPNCARCHR